MMHLKPINCYANLHPIFSETVDDNSLTVIILPLKMDEAC